MSRLEEILKEHVTTLRMGEHAVSLECSPELGESLEERALRELRENDLNRETGLEELRRLLRENGELNVPVDDDIFLLPFLRSCKFYPESAFKRMLALYELKEKNPKYFKDLRPSKDGAAFQHNIFTVLPYRDQHGRRILLVEVGKKWNPKKLSLTEIIRGIILIVEAALLEPKTQIAGASIIIDLEGLSVQHVWQFSPGIAKLILDYVQQCVPLRLKSVHVVNQPYIFNMLYAIFKPFIGEKLRNRIFFHGDNMAQILEDIDAKFLPTQYGGEMVLKTIYGPELQKLICQFEQEFIDANTRGLKNGKKK